MNDWHSDTAESNMSSIALRTVATLHSMHVMLRVISGWTKKIFVQLRQELDENLFRSSRYNPERVLHRLLLHPNNTGYNLRQRAHNLTLPSDVNSTTKQNFIFRMLFDAMCWLLNSIISHVLYFVYFLWVSLNFYLLHTALVICALKNYLLTLWPFCDLEKSFIVCSREETDHRGGQTVYANR